jgi:hypothetical protein
MKPLGNYPLVNQGDIRVTLKWIFRKWIVNKLDSSGLGLRLVIAMLNVQVVLPEN